MRVGLFAPLLSPVATPEFVDAYGRAAEECGFCTIWLAEHVVLFDDYASEYPYADDHRIPAGGENGFLDPLTTLGFLAAATGSIRLGTGICLVPQRNPVYTAKETATVDWLSNGRLDFGVGVGWLAEEYRAVDVSFDHRGARCREYLEVIRRLWCDDVSEFKGKFYELPACRQYPKPVQQPGPPIFFGGESDAALGRVADLGQGWFGFNADPEDVVERLTKLDELLARRDRTRSDVEVAISPYLKGCDADKLARYRDAGVDQVIVPGFAFELDAIRPTVEKLAETLVVPAHSL
jgi:probable F420-dependent oxidoreductase